MTHQTPVIAGIEITTDHAGRFNLNALHRASGAPDHKKPSEWLRTGPCQELVAELGSQSGQNHFGETSLVDIVRGGSAPGTFAHELLAISYAGWISPRFQLQVNQVFLDYRTGKLAAPAVPMNGDPRLDDIAKSLRLGLIDQAEATRRTRAILDGKAVEPAKLAAPKKPNAKAQAEPARWPLAEWSGEPTINIHDDPWPLREIAYFVRGGEPALVRALKEGGFITNAGRPTAKGGHLGAGKRYGSYLFKARATLKAIGAWPTR